MSQSDLTLAFIKELRFMFEMKRRISFEKALDDSVQKLL